MSIRSMTKSMEGGGMRRVLYLMILTMTLVGLIPSIGGAEIIPADEADAQASLRQENIAKVQTLLERKEVAAVLKDYGLTPEEVSSRLNELSDQQIAEIATEMDKHNIGGDSAVGFVVGLLVIVLLVLLILYLLRYIDFKNTVKGKRAGAELEAAPAPAS